ncbi:flagellar type III secretion system protein FlhB [Vogesella indigofera]|uniref:Flagellar type III secretion system protein FlhB n=1 Tax=Vogesella indigofera TaxID=45465 RepID=A0ABT5I1G4_VOGIN|nr:flagellar type III secretion system protein FlhB [Vogesella indigofera]MDC7689862.1 flagellar type III secretion system protein FlhB [Vogesella indigofera]
MAEAHNGDKTEKASPHKLREARKQGQVPRSKDVATAVGIVVAVWLSFWQMPDWLADFRRLFALAFASLGGRGTLENVWSMLFAGSLTLLVKMLLPLLVIPLLIVVFSLLPGGWIFVGQHFFPQLKRLNPLSHLGRVVSAKHASEVGKSILKALLLGGVLYGVALSAMQDFFALQDLPLDEALAAAGARLLQALLALAAVFVLFAVIDLPLQWLLFQREQRMSKQDLKDEYKKTEGSPQIKQRIRQVQQQLAQRGLRKSVPTADVIIVNPTHYAVALKYDEDRAEAPFIIAKGVDEMALSIGRIAAEHDIAVLTIPPLARAVYHTTQVNQQIPAPLYRAVAQVLTYVLQLKAFRSGQRRLRPTLPDDLPVPAHLANPKTTT